MDVQPLGVILAGGRSSRFGSDKALASIDGQAMLDRVAARLAPQCDRLLVAGRDWPELERIDDLPAPGLGPLGGLAGALFYARGAGHALVLTSGCDLPLLPARLTDLLAPADAVLAEQPTIGLWRSSQADALLGWLGRSERRSILAWVEESGARLVEGPATPNINRPEDLAKLRLPEGPRSLR